MQIIINPTFDYHGDLSWEVLIQTAAGSHESKYVKTIENVISLVKGGMEEIGRDTAAEKAIEARKEKERTIGL